MRKDKQAGAVVWYPQQGRWYPGRVFRVTTVSGQGNPLMLIGSVTESGVRVQVARRASRVRTRNPRAAR